MTLQRTEVLERVDAAADVIERHSLWAEQHCRLHQEAFDALVATGVPRFFLPSALGGLEVDPVTCALACERLANADTAAAWHVMVFNAARLMAAVAARTGGNAGVLTQTRWLPRQPLIKQRKAAADT